MFSPSTLEERLEDIQTRIQKTSVRSGRDPQEITLVAVTKAFPTKIWKRALNANLTTFGESRIQEAQEKSETFSKRNKIELHLIGHLQSNKVRKAIKLFDIIQTVDSIKLARKIDCVCGETSKKQPLFLQVNTGSDHKKICNILKGFNVGIIHNQNYETGISSSISTGVVHLPKNSSSAMICLADMPLLATNDYNDIIDFHQQNGGVSRIVAPFRKKTTGNPVIFGKNYFKQLRCLNGDKGGKEIFDNNSEHLVKFNTKSEGFYFDIDNKNDFLKLKSL